MDERKEILQDTIDRLIETALQELDQKLPEAGGEAALSHISDQLRQDAQLDEQHRKLMLDAEGGFRPGRHCHRPYAGLPFRLPAVWRLGLCGGGNRLWKNHGGRLAAHHDSRP